MVPLETVGAVILVYYVFMLGLEIDFKPITRLHHKGACCHCWHNLHLTNWVWLVLHAGHRHGAQIFVPRQRQGCNVVGNHPFLQQVRSTMRCRTRCRILCWFHDCLCFLWLLGRESRSKTLPWTHMDQPWWLLLCLAFVAKILCTMAVSWFFQMPHMDGLSLALLMNTKGTMPLIILCTGRDRLELDNQTFGVMLLACWLMTIPVGPVSVALTKASKTGKFQGSVQGATPDSPLKVLACIHTKRDANVIINLLKASCPSVRTPIQVLAVELNKNDQPPRLIAHHKGRSKTVLHLKSLRLDTEDTLGSFDNLSQAIFGEKMRIISDYNSMHKDILTLQDKEVALLCVENEWSPEVKLTVVRLVWENPNDEFDETDKEFIKGFVQQSGDVPRVRYLEKAVRDEKETVKL
ncbi:Cation/H(+) antiporter 15 [Spatholobus suberectus]|nr:Cation/H(+) antiporter 15 [Spatholobus suberectus]